MAYFDLDLELGTDTVSDFGAEALALALDFALDDQTDSVVWSEIPEAALVLCFGVEAQMGSEVYSKAGAEMRLGIYSGTGVERSYSEVEVYFEQEKDSEDC